MINIALLYSLEVFPQKNREITVSYEPVQLEHYNKTNSILVQAFFGSVHCGYLPVLSAPGLA